MNGPPKCEGAALTAPTVQQTSVSLNPTAEQRRALVVAQRISEAPQSCQKSLAQAFFGSASPRQAIKAMCLACVGFDRQSVRNCTGYSCPLWQYRPYVDDGTKPAPGPAA